RQRLECALLKGITAHYVMSRAGAAQAQARERELLAELASAIERGAPRTLDPLLRPSWEAAASDAARRRVVIDQVASLTDTAASAVITSGPAGTETLHYDKLLLTTGASPRRLNIPGAESDAVLYLRTIVNSERLRDAFRPGTRVVVAGAGWIGLETTAAARTA